VEWAEREGEQLGLRRQIGTKLLRNAPEGAKQMTVLSVGCLKALHQGCTAQEFPGPGT
jgi:hypothetical protein